jgi:hypothetical protein
MYKLLTTLMLITVGNAAYSAPMRYDCTLKSHSTHGWGVKEAIYWFDPADQSIMAIDPYIQHAVTDPIRVKPEKFGPPVYKFSYSLKLPTRQSGTIRVSFTVRFDAQKNRLTVEAFPGNNSRERSTGTCNLKK